MNTENEWVLKTWSEDAALIPRADFELLIKSSCAVFNSKTWSEFIGSIPPDEAEELRLWHQNDGEYVYDNGEKLLYIAPKEIESFKENYGDSYIIKHTDSFDLSSIPDVEGGDYPPWTYAAEKADYLPEEFLDKYGHGVSSMVSGSWYEFPIDKLEEMKLELKKHGISLVAFDDSLEMCPDEGDVEWFL